MELAEGKYLAIVKGISTEFYKESGSRAVVLKMIITRGNFEGTRINKRIFFNALEDKQIEKTAKKWFSHFGGELTSFDNLDVDAYSLVSTRQTIEIFTGYNGIANLKMLGYVGRGSLLPYQNLSW